MRQDFCYGLPCAGWQALRIELDKEARKLALEDEDLKLLWDWIGGLK